MAEHTFFKKDEWQRRLLSSLELSEDIVIVVAGREIPRWTDATDFATAPEIAAKSKVLINRLLQYANKESNYSALKGRFIKAQGSALGEKGQFKILMRPERAFTS
ncbi:MAG: hypothetical protein DRR19_11485 [Candidatus Parabeggiatoa sp. nov. 1]|nr:MAG: hypothetical protein DRR19_11485 [Gammaproteobacteria bacterium]